MDRQTLIESTSDKISQLPDIKINEVNDFVDFLLCKIDNNIICEGVQKLTADSKFYDFLKNEEYLYSVNGLKEMSR